MFEYGRVDVIWDFKIGDSLCYVFIGEFCCMVIVGKFLYFFICINMCVLRSFVFVI